MQQAGVRPRENTPWRKGQCSTGIWSSGQALSLPSAETLEKRLAESSSSDRRGWGGHWAHLRHPSCSELHSCISARCSAGRRNTHTGETCKSYLCPAVERWMCRFLWNICGFSQPCMDTCKLLPSWIGKCVFPLEFQTEWAIPATLSMRPGQKWTRSMLVRGYVLTMGPGSPSKFFSPIQCFIHLLTQCKPDGKCCPSLSACYSLHGEGIHVYKPGRNLLAILALGWTCR